MKSSISLGRLVLRGTVGTLAVKILSAAASLGMNVVLARALSTADYGVVAVGFSWVTVIAVIACFGSETASVRFVAQARAAMDSAAVSAVMQWGQRLALRFGAGLTAVSCVIVSFLYFDMEYTQRISLSVIVMSAPLVALVLNRAGVLRGAKKVVLSAAIETLIRPTLTITIIAALGWALVGRVSVTMAAFSIFAVSAASAALASALCRPLSRVVIEPTRAQKLEWIAVAKPLALMSAMGAVIVNVDIVLVGYFVNSDSAGIYRACAQVAALVSFGLAASNGIVAPLIAELYGQKRRAELIRVLRISIALVATIGICGALVMMAAGPWVLGIFGKEYVSGYHALLILLVAQVINAICGPTGFMMSMTGHQSAAAKIFAVSALFSVILNLTLIPWLGIIGAAIANLMGQMIWNFTILVFLRSRLGLDPSIVGWLPRKLY